MDVNAIVGPIQVDLDEASPWKVSAAAERTEAGVELIHFEFKTDTPQIPPRTEIRWSIPQLDIQARWNPTMLFNKNVPADWGLPITSNLAWGAPVMTFHNLSGENRLTVAVQEAMRPVELRGGVHEETNSILCKIILFTEQESPLTEYKTTLRLDMRHCFYADAIRDVADWFASFEEYRPAVPPGSAYDAIYSTWYSYHQNLFDHELEAECALAASVGLNGVIVDDGWQTDDNNRGYAFCGDWKVAKRRFPDMKEHVRKIHDQGMKYMLWYSVPFVGFNSENHKRFDGKYLFHFENLKASVLDPRFPEVREFLVNIYETALREWDLDGFKLDFIDSFHFDGEDPAVAEDYAGRDIRSLPLAVNQLLSDVMARLRALKPDILIEFRQNYIGPAIRKYGNMFRAADCPADVLTNRVHIMDLRLFSGNTAIHSDMLEWNMAESVETAALQFLNILFSVPQISIRFADLPADHRKMLQFWLDFAKEHKETLLKSKLTPLHPEMNYPVIIAENDQEKIIGVYLAGQVVKVSGEQPVCMIVNASDAEEMILDIAGCPAAIAMYATTGEPVKAPELREGLNKVCVPRSGLLKIKF